MSKDNGLKSLERRKFFRKAGIGIGAAGAVALGVPAEPAKAAGTTDSDVRAGGYRETEHVKKAYQSARY
jgi:hypothetical protein